ncbi:MAG: transposase [Thermodesulfobacteriota bacterium]|nr:transposase [Thermodesulfobacteriota bacterium]
MPRVARLDIPGLLQHVIVRGVERKDIFLDDRDRRQFLNRLSDILGETETLCYAWSLMPNHFHLLLLPTRFKLAVVMRRLLTGYAVTFNLMHNRVGHLFQNRYKSIVCDKDVYLLELVRYIHLNPIRACLVETIDDLDRYPWSGHAVLMGYRKVDGQVVDEVLHYFGRGVSRARIKYRDFMADGLQAGRRDDLVGIRPNRKQLIEGDVKGIDDIDSRILGDRVFMGGVLKNKTLSEKGRVFVRLPELVDTVSSILHVNPELIRQPSKIRLIAEARGVISYMAIRELGYMGLEVGKELNLGPAGVSIALRRGERILRERTEIKEKILRKLAK